MHRSNCRQCTGLIVAEHTLGLPGVNGVQAALRYPRLAPGKTTRPAQGGQPTPLVATLVPTPSPHITSERAGDLSLLCPALIHEAHHREGFACPVARGEVSQRHAADDHHSVAAPLLKAAAVVDHHDPIGKADAVRKQDGIGGRRCHTRSCLGSEKGGQPWVRTLSEDRPCVFRELGGVGQEVWNLVTQCDGSLFVVGAHNTKRSGRGHDWVDWYSVTIGPNNTVGVAKIGKHHLYFDYPEGSSGKSRHCNLQAAGGTYVDPDGRLLFYSTEHDNDGPIGSVKFEEFRSKTLGDCPTIDQAWTDLYADPDYKDRGVTLDYADRNFATIVIATM